MLAMAARKMNYRTVVLDPDPNCPAGQVADGQITDAYSSRDGSLALARQSSGVCSRLERLALSGQPRRASLAVCLNNAEGAGKRLEGTKQ